MSDGAMEKTEAPAGAAEAPAAPAINFDKAELDEAGGEHVECAACKRVITTEYWQLLGKVLCDACRLDVHAASAVARSAATFGKAFLMAGLTALACGVGYAIFVGLTSIQFALVTIGIGWLVGRAVQRATSGFGTRKHQILAVALTYSAACMGYFPAVFKGIQSSAPAASLPAVTAHPAPPSAADAPSAPAAALPAPSAPAQSAAPSAGAGAEPISALGVLFGLVLLFVITLAAPLLDLTSGFGGIMGALIMFFGVQTAWRTARGVAAEVTGPYSVSKDRSA